MIHEIFKQTQDSFGIKNKVLAAKVGISPKHLSEFRAGKTNLSLELLWEIVLALDELAPGARRELGRLMAGEEGFFCQPRQLIAQLSPQQRSDLLIAIAEEMRTERLSHQELVAS